MFGENNSGRPNFADNRYDATLDRSWFYDAQGRLEKAYTGKEANSLWGSADGNYAQGFSYDQWGNLTQRYGWGGEHANYSASYNNKNQRPEFAYDAAGNLLNDGGQSFTYNAIGQQATASFGISEMAYDGDGLRIKKTENGATTYYLRSSVLGGQVVAELSGSGAWQRGYVYLGGQLLAMQDVGYNRVLWVHQEPYAKAQRLTDAAGAVISGVEVDPFGGETNRSFDNPPAANHRRRYTSYERDGNGGDEAQQRRYERWYSRFYQPDPYDGSYDLTNPQSLNRYSYVQNDPVNFVDPTGLDDELGMYLDRLRREYDAYESLWSLYTHGLERPIPQPEVARDTNPGGGPGDLIGNDTKPNNSQDQSKPIYCQKNIINAMRSAWQRAGNGTRNTEAGFITYRGRDSQIGTANLPNTNQDRRISFKISNLLPAGATATAIFHTHPNSGSATPSTGGPPSDVDTANRTRLPIYVISNRGLNVYDPAARQTTEVRDSTEWQKPCGE